jgi:hypothetical protein
MKSSGEPFEGEIRPSRDRRFAQFETMEHGYRAMFVLLRNYRTKYGCNTVRKVIGRWAPKGENDTEGYVRFVSRKTGLGPDAVFDCGDKGTMMGIVRAIAEMENGTKPDTAEMERGWELFSD